MVSLVHEEHHYVATALPETFTPSVTPTPGNLMVIAAATRAAGDKLTGIPGWTIVESAMGLGLDTGCSMFYRVAQAGDDDFLIAASQCELEYSEWAGAGALVASASQEVDPPSSPYTMECGGSVIAPSGALVIGTGSMLLQNDTDSFTGTPDAGVIELDDWATTPSVNGNPGRWTGYRIATGGATMVSCQGAVGGIAFDYRGITAVFGPAAEPPHDVDILDPTGVLLAQFDNLIDHKERAEYNGTGSGYLVINKHDPQATAELLAKGNIVRVTYPEIDPALPYFEWILEDGDFALVSNEEQGGEDLTFSGRGTLAAGAYTILGHQNLTDPPRNHPTEGVWRWNSEEWAGIVRRLIDEAQAHSPPALSFLTRDWSDTTDSDGDPFFDMDGEWEITMGVDLLTAWLDLAKAGMGQLEMRPGFLLRAYDDMGDDKSGSFGPTTVRFEAGVNVTTEVSRGMAGRLWASSVLIHTKDGWLWFPSADPVPYTKEVLLDLTNMNGTNAQERAAARRLLRGELAAEGVIFEHSPVGPNGEENDPEGGWYYPGWAELENGRYWLGDLVSFHTGTDETDFNEAVFQVQAITTGRDEAGQFAPPIVELNAPWGASEQGAAPVGTTREATPAAGGGGGSGGAPGPHVHTQYQPTAEKSQAEGYASLDADGLVPSAELGTGGAGAGAKFLTDAQTFVTPTPPVVDHGALTGLADDDHPQYATNAEFDDHNLRHQPGGADAMAVDAAAGVGSLRTLGSSSTAAAPGDHDHGSGGGPGLDPDAVRDAGRWEVAMIDGTSSPPEPAETEDGTDWTYIWVTD